MSLSGINSLYGVLDVELGSLIQFSFTFVVDIIFSRSKKTSSRKMWCPDEAT